MAGCTSIVTVRHAGVKREARGLRESLPRLPARSPRNLPLGYDQLLSQQSVLGDELQVRSENVCREVASEPEEVEHGPARTPIGSGWHF